MPIKLRRRPYSMDLAHKELALHKAALDLAKDKDNHLDRDKGPRCVISNAKIPIKRSILVPLVLVLHPRDPIPTRHVLWLPLQSQAHNRSSKRVVNILLASNSPSSNTLLTALRQALATDQRFPNNKRNMAHPNALPQVQV